MTITQYIQGDLFTSTDSEGQVVLAHACNTQGSWGGGIAAVFKKKYPMAFKQYNEHCNSHTDLLGTALLVEESGTSIACLFTSDFTQTPHQIVKHTENALRDLFNQVGHCKVNIPKINSGIFNVPWELTEAVLINSELEFNVYIW